MEPMELIQSYTKYLNGGGEKPDFQGADFRDMGLRGVDLRYANLHGAKFQDADLQFANLRGADLQLADLRNADLRNADLQEVKLIRVKLQGADLRGANLQEADLQDANLRGVKLQDANLLWADFQGSTGWIPLLQTDHGHMIAAVWHWTHWRIQGGCRDFTIYQAREHWGSPSYRCQQTGSRIIHMLDWLEKQPTPPLDNY